MTASILPKEAMLKYFSEIERNVYAAECQCKQVNGTRCKGEIPECPFRKKYSENYTECLLYTIRLLVGDAGP